MAYVLFALSALMIIFGVYSLVTGYPVVQVEEGWTAVISGSTFIASGVVTAALGLVLRVLVQIRNSLAGGLRTAGIEEPLEDEPVAIAEPSAAEGPDEPVLPPAPVALAPAPPPMVTGDRAEAPPPPPPFLRRKPPANVPAVEESPADVAPAEEPIDAPDLHGDWLDQALQPHDTATPIHDPGPSPAPDVEQTPNPVEPPPVHAREAPPAPPPAPPARLEPRPAPPEQEPELEAPPVAPELEPEPAHENHQAPVASAKVIGRYEADGTSYVMYADGSIEAQTEAGVYRFASMAELKSFIET